MPATLTRLVEAYLDHLIVERGVSRHTAAAYRRDLRRYVDYLAERGVTEPDQVTSALIGDYAMRLREGVRARTEKVGPSGRWRVPARLGRWSPCAACTGSLWRRG